MKQGQVTERPADPGVRDMDVRFVAGDSYEVSVRGHRVLVDQPADAGGQDTAPTPTELFVASLAACVAFYAGRYLTRHGYCRDGLIVSAGFDMASDRPARVSGIRLTVQAPADLPAAPASGAARGGLALHGTQQPDVSPASRHRRDLNRSRIAT